MEKIPAVFVEGLTDDQRRAYIIADNKLTELGGWDEEILKEELAELDFNGFDISLTGFSFDDDFNEQIESLDVVLEDNSDDLEIPNDPQARLGEVYQLGDHVLMCGDSTNINDVEKLTGKRPIDLVVTDPPYNVAVNKKAGKL